MGKHVAVISENTPPVMVEVVAANEGYEALCQGASVRLNAFCIKNKGHKGQHEAHAKNWGRHRAA